MAGRILRRANPGKAKGLPRERVLQADCVRLYALGLGHRQSILFAVPNGEDRHPVVAAILSGFNIETRRQMPHEDRLMPGGQGLLPGSPDLILLTAGAGVTLIECKTEADPVRGLAAGKKSREQLTFEDGAKALGHDYRVITNTTAFWDLCAEKGIRLRVQRPAYLPPTRLPSVVQAAKSARSKKAKAQAPGPFVEPPGRHRWDLP